jgi:hypothetical protein
VNGTPEIARFSHTLTCITRQTSVKYVFNVQGKTLHIELEYTVDEELAIVGHTSAVEYRTRLLMKSGIGKIVLSL